MDQTQNLKTTKIAILQAAEAQMPPGALSSSALNWLSTTLSCLHTNGGTLTEISDTIDPSKEYFNPAVLNRALTFLELTDQKIKEQFEKQKRITSHFLRAQKALLAFCEKDGRVMVAAIQVLPAVPALNVFIFCNSESNAREVEDCLRKSPEHALIGAHGQSIRIVSTTVVTSPHNSLAYDSFIDWNSDDTVTVYDNRPKELA